MYKLIEPDTVEHSEELVSLLRKVNSHYNKFEYVTDLVQFNQLDYWTAQLDKFSKGDCDDYALSKRKKLIEEGVPYQCLFPTICTVGGGGHLVLVVRTTKHDLLLDNIRKTVDSISKVNYNWLYRLDPVNKKWIRIH